VEHDEVTVLGRPGHELEHLPGGVSADDEHSVVGVDQADGVGDGVADRLVADTMAPSRPGHPHTRCVPQYQDGEVTR